MFKTMLMKQPSAGPRVVPTGVWLDSSIHSAFQDDGEIDAHLPLLGGCVIDGDAVRLFDVDVNPIAALPTLKLAHGRA